MNALLIHALIANALMPLTLMYAHVTTASLVLTALLSWMSAARTHAQMAYAETPPMHTPATVTVAIAVHIVTLISTNAARIRA